MNNLAVYSDYVVAALLIGGALFMLVGSWGLAKLPDFYTRLHAPTKASTLGMGATLLGSLVWFSVQEESLHIHELVISIFLFLTAPVSAYMMGKAAIHRRRPLAEGTRNAEEVERAAERKGINDRDDD
ncbi:Na+/H+ antiporter subunit G [Thalassolituus sp.]|uniref:Na+/H+ antiporter subunit G n=1 Tax=Thalassolituus sp. TaxID=2030822 RepID=UPI000ED4DA7A|nr:Na+/H+ antiporter subunit G [Thalassolituus sp.]MEC8909148.1 Na+/H+ antiporter subunit G [Pseudomonadota bacterium]HCG78535.1 Na+/H+ antiporter subunit G [Oceanospirillales bacterium]MEC9256651.1 Na+/H+ antiporter subunit G [Pseudomonadota bacterium]MED5442130.1 Na+/H+ antiporter subunit G [Pseudomonadota bacterium]MEE3159799.1 Na+/H+ antiporter subunit G [Pseudomonadota bacterium]